MPWLHELGASLATFAATNVDDLVLLAAWFADPTLRARTIVFGQLLGIGALVATSALAALLAIAVPAGVPALLGVVPLWLGLRLLWRLFTARDEHGDGDEPEAPPRAHWQVLAVAAVTIGNGGDNLAVYVPLFASAPANVGLHVAVFAAMTLLWCALARVLVRHPALGGRLQQQAHRALPFVLIALGIFILRDAAVLLG